VKTGSVFTVRVRSRIGSLVAIVDGVDGIGHGAQSESDELAQGREGRVMGDGAVGLVITSDEESIAFFLSDAFLPFPGPLPGV